MWAMGDQGRHYSEAGFWKKVGTIPIVGPLPERAIILWLVLQDEDTPLAIKALAVAALGYLILTLDCCPDILPGGLLDDLAVISATIATIHAYVTPSIHVRARKLLYDT
jgi:uncharacterized membrane protein YkvA (DUF1232 family)